MCHHLLDHHKRKPDGDLRESAERPHGVQEEDKERPDSLHPQRQNLRVDVEVWAYQRSRCREGRVVKHLDGLDV